jgi:DNA-binding transcriptional ArsR family regulator
MSDPQDLPKQRRFAMSKTIKTTEQPASETAILKALASTPEATATEVASTAGLGRSTTSKVLARLQAAGKVTRTEGGREGRRLLPDRWALTSARPAGKTTSKKATHSQTDAERLRPGQLDGLVLAYLKKNVRSGPHGPTAIARALNRSSGAVANCLVRLTRAEQVQEISEHPRRYNLAA